MRFSLLICLSLFGLGCATATVENDKFNVGENLIQPMPLPEASWEAYSKKEGHHRITKWIKHGSNDEVGVHIGLNDGNKNLLEDKSFDDKVGKDTCTEFTSDNASIVLDHGYKTLTWKSACKINSEATIVVLHKTLSGNDSYYHIRRIWRSGVTDQSLSLWEDYFKNVYLCDARASDASLCPEGFSKVK